MSRAPRAFLQSTPRKLEKSDIHNMQGICGCYAGRRMLVDARGMRFCVDAGAAGMLNAMQWKTKAMEGKVFCCATRNAMLNRMSE